MSDERQEQETVADIVAEIRRLNPKTFLVSKWCCEPLPNRMRSYADRIEAALKREKAKPVRNCDKYKTAKGAFVGFNEMCDGKTCYRCPFSAERNECINCMLNWLYAEADK